MHACTHTHARTHACTQSAFALSSVIASTQYVCSSYFMSPCSSSCPISAHTVQVSSASVFPSCFRSSYLPVSWYISILGTFFSMCTSSLVMTIDMPVPVQLSFHDRFWKPELFIAYQSAHRPYTSSSRHSVFLASSL